MGGNNEDTLNGWPRSVGNGFAVPVLAQKQNTVDPEVRQQIEAARMKFSEAFNKHDAAAVAALYTENAVEVRSFESAGGLISGREALEKRFAIDFANSRSPMVNELVQVNAVGNDI